MPLNKRQFDLGIDDEIETWMRQVYEILVTHQDLAYSDEELLKEVLGESPGISKSAKFGRALLTLDSLGAVEKRQVHESQYYAFSREINTNTWALDLSIF